MLTGLLPAAGYAKRFGGVPKFLLPIERDGSSLIDVHVRNFSDLCDEILIGTQGDYVELLTKRFQENHNVRVQEIASDTFCETLTLLTQESSGDEYILALPDSYIGTVNFGPLVNLAKEGPLGFGLWRCPSQLFGQVGQVEFNPNQGKVLSHKDKTNDCKFEFMWGALALNRQFLDFIDTSEDHLGTAIDSALQNFGPLKGELFEGRYHDCGSIDAYMDAHSTATSSRES